MDSPSQPLPAKPTRRGSLIGGLLIGGSLAAMGVLFCSLLWKSYSRAMETRGWAETPCAITAAWIGEEPFAVYDRTPSYKVEVRYKYELHGESFTGTKIRRVDGRTRKKDKVDALLERYPAGLNTVCYVNPAEPTTAILKHETKAALYSIWFPALFVVGGIGIAIGAVVRAVRFRRSDLE
jgi:hypothetical protein